MTKLVLRSFPKTHPANTEWHEYQKAQELKILLNLTLISLTCYWARLIGLNGRIKFIAIISGDVLVISCAVDNLFSTFLSCCVTGIFYDSWTFGTFALVTLSCSCPIMYFHHRKSSVVMKSKKKDRLLYFFCISACPGLKLGVKKSLGWSWEVLYAKVKKRMVRSRKMGVLLVYEMMEARLGN